MSVTYDGNLRVIRQSGKVKVEPCCPQMHECLVVRQFYPTASGQLALKHRGDDRGEVVSFCPFCGTRVVQS